MAATDNQPSNKNFLSPFGFKFSIKKTPNTNWFVQSINLPSIVLPRTDVSNPFVSIPLGGDHLQFGPLEVEFIVDEDLNNYSEIYDWLIGIGFPDDFTQHKAIAQKIPGKNVGGNVDIGSGTSILSDATLMILSSAMNPIIEINFVDLFPTSISDLSFNSQLSEVDYIKATASFAYRKFSLIRI